MRKSLFRKWEIAVPILIIGTCIAKMQIYYREVMSYDQVS